MNDLRAQLDRIQRAALIVGVLGLALSTVGGFVEARQAAFSYLFAFVFWVGLPLGCLCVLMMHYLTGGGWGYPIRRFLEAGIATLPLMGLLFVPVVLSIKWLYPWTNPAIVAHNEALQKIHGYLNVPTYLGRMVAFFALWIGAAWFLNREGARQDETVDPAPTRRIRTFSGPAMLVFVLTVSLALVDWVMVLEQNWYSTVYPAQVIIGMILVAFAFCTVMLGWTVGPAPFKREESPLSGIVKVEHFHSLGNFQLAFVMMWAYLTVSQLIIIWSGNEPREISWYLHRTAGVWRYVAITLGLFYFALPFFLLLSREHKKSVRYLGGVAVLIFAMHALELWWQVMPSLHQQGLSISWLDFTTFYGMGGVWLALFLARLKTHLSVPQHDPRMEEALAHGH